MAIQWLRRAWLLAAGASALVLAACGGGSIDSSLSPTRIVVFGDAMADLGQSGSRYTVNDDSVNNWTQYVANDFGLTLAPSARGGTSYATGNARVAAKPDAGGSAATPTVVEQVSSFLGGSSVGSDDLFILSAGTSDVIVQAQATLSGAQAEDQMLANLGQAGRDLGAQVRRLVDAGASHVVVSGPYNLGRSAWATDLGSSALLEKASSHFNQQLLLTIPDLGEKVLYIDAALYFNLQSGTSSNEFNNVTGYVCTSVDPGPGIGTGVGQVNSRLCTTSTIRADVNGNYNSYLWADRVYPTPRGHQRFGDYARGRIKERW
jgi:outer membrane lipase/esterase